MKNWAFLLFTMLMIAISETVCASDAVKESNVKGSEVAVSEVVLREMLPGVTTTTGYFTLQNLSDKPLTLQGVSSSLAVRIEIHEHQMNQGMMTMKKVEGDIIIEPQQTLVFQPGGLHLMIFNPLEAINHNLKTTFIFKFKHKPAITVAAKVVSVMEQQSKQQTHHH